MQLADGRETGRYFAIQHCAAWSDPPPGHAAKCAGHMQHGAGALQTVAPPCTAQHMLCGCKAEEGLHAPSCQLPAAEALSSHQNHPKGVTILTVASALGLPVMNVDLHAVERHVAAEAHGCECSGTQVVQSLLRLCCKAWKVWMPLRQAESQLHTGHSFHASGSYHTDQCRVADAAAAGVGCGFDEHKELGLEGHCSVDVQNGEDLASAEQVFQKTLAKFLCQVTALGQSFRQDHERCWICMCVSMLLSSATRR